MLGTHPKGAFHSDTKKNVLNKSTEREKNETKKDECNEMKTDRKRERIKMHLDL